MGSNRLNVFAHTTPARTAPAVQSALAPFSVHTPADRPYGVLFALATASAGVRNVSTDSTGPKFSSRATRIVCSTSENTVGGKNRPRSGSGRAGPAPGALGVARGREVDDPVQLGRELIAPTSVFLSSGSPTRSVAIRGAQQLHQLVGDRLLHQQPGARAAHMALVEEDPLDDALDGLVQRRVVVDDVGRLAAELQVSRLPVPASLRWICLPTSVEPVNATLATPGCPTTAAPTSPAPGSTLSTPRAARPRRRSRRAPAR